MSRVCSGCGERIRPGLAVLRGNGRAVLAWHKPCYARHTQGAPTAAEIAVWN